MDILLLKQQIAGEFCPRYYALSGEVFDVMLDAVQKLGAKYSGPGEKAWLVDQHMIHKLYMDGYTVEQEPDVRVELVHGNQDIKILDYGARVHVTLNYRLKSGNWAVAPNIDSLYEKTLRFVFDPGQISQVAESIRNHESTKHLSPERRDAFCHRNALYALVGEKIGAMNHEADLCCREHIGKRTAEEYEQAVRIVWERIVQGVWS